MSPAKTLALVRNLLSETHGSTLAKGVMSFIISLMPLGARTVHALPASH